MIFLGDEGRTFSFLFVLDECGNWIRSLVWRQNCLLTWPVDTIFYIQSWFIHEWRNLSKNECCIYNWKKSDFNLVVKVEMGVVGVHLEWYVLGISGRHTFYVHSDCLIITCCFKFHTNSETETSGPVLYCFYLNFFSKILEEKWTKLVMYNETLLLFEISHKIFGSKGLLLSKKEWK